jgi:allophanate hydrolase
MDIPTLHGLYRSGDKKPIDVVNQCLNQISESDTNAWIVTRDAESVRREAREIGTKSRADLPLYGIPFAVKDNIDYKGLPTTAGCPSYSYQPNEHATVVQSLIDAGAILLGKTNMDQFATGLVGTRSPHGPCKNVFNDEFISGGSSSGSAVAVANEQVCFALGTDTAGSGRIPAAFNGLVGLKPTRGLVSTHGVVPACKSLDCVSIFANSIDDATQIGQVAIGYDEKDPYSRSKADNFTLTMNKSSSPHIGVPTAENLEFFGDEEAESCFEVAVGRAQSISESITHIDFTPFIKAAKLLYQGPWVAERFSAVGEFLETNPDDADPVVKRIIESGADYSAVDVFEAFYELQTYKHQATNVFDSIDVLVTPTAGTIYTIDEIDSNPVELNSNLGYYTNFANLLDLSAVSVPTGSFESGPSFGTTVFGEKYADSTVASVASELTNK